MRTARRKESGRRQCRKSDRKCRRIDSQIVYKIKQEIKILDRERWCIISINRSSLYGYTVDAGGNVLVNWICSIFLALNR